MTKNEIKALLAIIGGAWPSFQINEATVRAWEIVFSDMETKIAEFGLQQVLRMPLAFPPSPGQVYDAGKESERLINCPDTDETIWTYVVGLASRRGIVGKTAAQQEIKAKYPSNWEHICAAVRSVSWLRICHADITSELHFARNDFLRAMKSEKTNEQKRFAIGMSEAQKLVNKINPKLLQ